MERLASHVESSHFGHVAYFILALLIGAIVGYYVGFNINAANTQEDLNSGVGATSAAPKTTTSVAPKVATTSVATTPAY